ncbi:hypothetical protein Tco_1493276 [Tanacetum coccineum]
MNKNKTANRNPANYHLYHALIKALIADEDAMDKEVAVKVKDHKRKHDSDDDDEGPSAGSNQGRSAKRRRPESAAFGSAQPPSKDDHQSSKKPRESDASASKQHPALTSTGWQITDTRDDVVNSKAVDIMKALKESKKMSKRQPGTGGSNEGTGNILGVPDESTVISRASSEGAGSKPGSLISHLLNQYLLPVKNHSLQLLPPTSALQQSSSVLEMVKSRLLCNSVSGPYYNLPPRTVSPAPVAIVASRAVDPVGSLSTTTIDQDEQFYRPVPQLMAPDHSSSRPVLHEMMSDRNSSDLAPQRQEINNVVPFAAEKTDSSQQGLEFLFSPLLEEYYNPTHGQAEENNNNQAPNASFQEEEFINLFCTRVQEIGESSSRNIDNTDVHSFQPQSHDYRWTKDHPLEQVRGNPTMLVQTRRQFAADPEMCMFTLTVSIVEPKNIKEAMADSRRIEAMQLKVSLDRGVLLKNHFAPDARLDAHFQTLDHSLVCFDTRKSTLDGDRGLGINFKLDAQRIKTALQCLQQRQISTASAELRYSNLCNQENGTSRTNLELVTEQSQPLKILWDRFWELPQWLLYNGDWVSRSGMKMILARERSGFAGKKVWDDIPVVTGFVGRERRL